MDSTAQFDQGHLARATRLIGRPVTEEPGPRYQAHDLRSEFFSDPSRKKELAKLYMDVFNGVQGIEPQWNFERAYQFIDSHARTPGCNIALLDTQTDRLIAAFLSHFAPTHMGLTLSGRDSLVHMDYRKQRIGSALFDHGMNQAVDICNVNFNTRLIGDVSTTYSETEHPKSMWVNRGYALRPLYTLAAEEVRQHAGNNNLTVRQGDEAETDAIAHFISDAKTIDSGEAKWDFAQARSYAAFMIKHHKATFVVTKKNDAIVAVSAMTITIGRDGPYGTEVRCFVSNARTKDAENIVRSSFARLLDFADGATVHSYGEKTGELQITEPGSHFFRRAYPHLQEDKKYLSIHGGAEMLDMAGRDIYAHIIARENPELQGRMGQGFADATPVAPPVPAAIVIDRLAF